MLYPWHPALPALSRLLHDEPGLLDAVRELVFRAGRTAADTRTRDNWRISSFAANDLDDLHDTMERHGDAFRKLATALATKGDGDGKNG